MRLTCLPVAKIDRSRHEGMPTRPGIGLRLCPAGTSPWHVAFAIWGQACNFNRLTEHGYKKELMRVIPKE